MIYLLSAFLSLLSLYYIANLYWSLIHFLCVSALGTSVLWVPGALRLWAHIIFRPFSRSRPGISEAALLNISAIPQHIQLIIDSQKYPLVKLSKSPCGKVYYLIEFTLSLITHLLRVSNCLASASLQRYFSCKIFSPLISLRNYEVIIIYLFIGVILCSFLQN